MPSRSISARQKRAVAERSQGCCEYCQSQSRYAVQPFSIEHILPRSQGGEAELENLALACQGCNNHKYNKFEAQDPVSREIVPLLNPRRQRWADHFAWSTDFTVVIGLTPSGRAKVETLKLNRQGVVNMRRILYAIGGHPPVLLNRLKEK
ncbi:MAG: HNH endonuclease signature motif containing protein [Chloroflexota bacterium]